MITNKELVPLKKKIQTVADRVSGFEITNEDTMKEAVIILSQMNSYADSVKEKKELLTKPLNEALKNARAMFKPLEETYEGAIEELRGKMTRYQTEQVRLQKAEEAKIVARVGEGRGKLSIETATKRMEAVKTVEKEVASEVGLVQFREVKRYEVVDIKVLPIEYHMANDKLIAQAMKDGKEIAGVKYWTEQVPVNYRA